MSHYTRRDLLRMSAGLGITTALSSFAPLAFSASGESLKGKLHILSAYSKKPEAGTRFRDLEGVPNSMITSIDLKSGDIKQSEIPIKKAHVALDVGNDALFCTSHHGDANVVLDPEHKAMQVMKVPKHYRFSGHGLILKDEGVIIAPARHEYAERVSDNGLFVVYDLKTFKALDQLNSGGLHPHEVHAVANTNELVVTHYGDLATKSKQYINNVVDPKLTVLDRKTLKPIRHYPVADKTAMLTHMDVTPDGYAYCVQSQFVKNKVADDATDKEKREIAKKILSYAMQHDVAFDIPQASIDFGRIPLPLPVLKINVATGEMQSIYTADKQHLRGQSVACNEQTGVVVSTFYHSGCVMFKHPDKEPEVIASKTFGFDYPCGVSEIPNTTLVAISGSEGGVAIYDVATAKIVAKFAVTYPEALHVTYESA